LSLLVLLTFAPVRDYAFVNFDDREFISENPVVSRGLSADGVIWSLTNAYAATGGPVTWLSHMLDVELFGLDAGSHHVVSVVIHLFSTLILFALLIQLTDSVGRSAVVAGLFAVHPLHVESVAWIAERKDVLSGAFLWLTLLAYVSWVRRPSISRYAAVAGFLALGLLSKPTVVIAPILMLLLDVWPLRRAAAPAAGSGAIHRLIREKVPLLMLAAGATAWTFVTQTGIGAVSSLADIPLGTRIVNMAVSCATYFVKMIWPANLAVFYPYQTAWPVTVVLGSIGLIVVVTGAVIVTARRWPIGAFGWAWYAIALLPVIGLIQAGGHATADRATYLALVGLFLPVVFGADDLLEASGVRSMARAAVACLVLVAVAAVARQQVATWRDSRTLWEHAIRVTSNNDRAHGNLGVILAEHGSHREAIAHFTEAIRITPAFAHAHHNLGLSRAALGDVEGATEAFRAAIKLAPDYAKAHYHLAETLANAGKYEEAIPHCRAATRLTPDSADAHYLLAVSLGTTGRTAEALHEFEEALRRQPANPAWHYTRAMLFMQVGRRDDAIGSLETALRLDPANDVVRRTLASIKGGPPQ
jgi:Flp pilus assembly protein TadD